MSHEKCLANASLKTRAIHEGRVALGCAPVLYLDAMYQPIYHLIGGQWVDTFAVYGADGHFVAAFSEESQARRSIRHMHQVRLDAKTRRVRPHYFEAK